MDDLTKNETDLRWGKGGKFCGGEEKSRSKSFLDPWGGTDENGKQTHSMAAMEGEGGLNSQKANQRGPLTHLETNRLQLVGQTNLTLL